MKHRIPEIFNLKKKPGPGFCIVAGCRKEKSLDRKGNVKKLGLCHGHYQHAWRLCNEKKSAYATLRDHAVRRGIVFSLSPEYFAGLVDAYGFFEHKADEFKDYLSLDRADCTKGYVAGNVRVCTVSENVIKGHAERHLPHAVQHYLAARRAECQAALPVVEEYDEDPF